MQGGIRHTGFNLTLQNVWVRDNDYGLRATRGGLYPQNDFLDIYGSVFEQDGDEDDTGFGHNIAVGNCARLAFASQHGAFTCRHLLATRQSENMNDKHTTSLTRPCLDCRACPGTRFRFHNSISRDTIEGGQLIRSDADLTEIHHSVVASLTGQSSRELDFPSGGRVDIRDSVIVSPDAALPLFFSLPLPVCVCVCVCVCICVRVYMCVYVCVCV